MCRGSSERSLQAIKQIGFEATIRGKRPVLGAGRIGVGIPGADHRFDADGSRVRVDRPEVDSILVIGPLEALELGRGCGHEAVHDGQLAAAETTARVLGKAGWQERLTGKPHPSFGEVVRAYLSPRHRDDPGTGCLLSALGSDAARQPRAVRRAFTDGFRARIDALVELVPGRSQAVRREKALATMAGLVGALILSRAVDDPALSDEILAATATELGRR